jgi:hypothetical protein
VTGGALIFTQAFEGFVYAVGMFFCIGEMLFQCFGQWIRRSFALLFQGMLTPRMI